VTSWLDDLGVTLPVLAAPMAGGPSTPDFVIAAGRARSLGFLAAGYKTPELLAEQIGAVRAASLPFGVNVFAPNPVPVDLARFRAYAEAVQADADTYGVVLGGAAPVEDDDHWAAKIEVLRADPVPVVSFTFGVPEPSVVRALQRAGTLVVQTVTSADEARIAVTAGVDALAVQSSAAGGHSGTLTPARLPASIPLPELIARVRAVTTLPLIGAGGVATAAAVDAVLHAGADAVMVGTVLLLTPESGTSSPYRSALLDPDRHETVVTRAFTGRPARALRNRFIERYDALAPEGYPAVHHLTSPLRRAATAAGDPELINLWAGTGHRHASTTPVADLLAALSGG
jgi:NAD(P)H-dependent flavin oxidoreductase YrpB (nitropropane dioxygenase family)